MAAELTAARTSRKPLRLWPGVLLVALQWLAWAAIPLVLPGTAGYGVIGGLVGGLLVLVWWLFFSRAPWSERLGAVLLMILAAAAARPLLHASIAGGMMGMMFYLYVIPVFCLALVVWAVAGRDLAPGPRRVWLVVAVVLACGVFALFRTGGMTGDADSDFHWRWTKTPEELLLARAGAEPATAGAAEDRARAREEPGKAEQPGTAPVPSDETAAARSPEEPPAPEGQAPVAAPGEPLGEPSGDGLSAPVASSPPPAPAAEWPGFRGPDRDGVLHGVRIATDWSASRPVELWRRPIGPGWSSFAVHGDRLYTQEQRGEDEIVACYDAATGEPVWSHRDAARFWESNAGAGPRATPTLRDGRVYTLGATGILNVLEAADGAVVWSRNAVTDTGVEIPGWGIASSPLVVDDVVIVATAGVLAAYDLASGEPRWSGPAGGWGYSSPHLATIGGIRQVLLLDGAGVLGVAPADGTVLWKYEWRGDGIVQPALTADGDLLLGTGSGMGSGAGMGVRRIAVTHGPGGWTTEERWTSAGLKPYFNDFVVHKGHAFGFDGSILACIDLADGERAWKGGRYGHGQLLLLAEQDLLLVLSERGELALVAASPDRFTELARLPAIEGKTWNHPVLVGDLLLARNGQEMVAFRLAPADG